MRRRSRSAFPVRPQYASTELTRNPNFHRPLGSRADCIQVVVGFRARRHYKALLRTRYGRKAAYEGAGKRSTCGSYCRCALNSCVLCSTWILGSVGIGWSELVGTAPPDSASRCSCLVPRCGILPTLLSQDLHEARPASLVLFWTAVAVLILVTLFPQVIASLIAG